MMLPAHVRVRIEHDLEQRHSLDTDDAEALLECIDAQTERIAALERDLAERERLLTIERAARRFAEAVPYYHELADYVEYEAAYLYLCLALNVEPAWRTTAKNKASLQHDSGKE